MSGLVLPTALLSVGLVVAWMTMDRLHSGTRGLLVLRLALGLVLVLAGFGILVVFNLHLDSVVNSLVVVGLTLAGVSLVLGPWLWSSAGEMVEERRRRIRSEERTEMAVHLHDSVLQTLSLIQRNAADPAQTAALARRQERELRGGSSASRPRTGRARFAGRWRRWRPRSRMAIAYLSRSWWSEIERWTSAPMRCWRRPGRRW